MAKWHKQSQSKFQLLNCLLISHIYDRCLFYSGFVIIFLHVPPKNGLIALQTPRTSRLSTFFYCQAVSPALLSTYILVWYNVIAMYNIKLSDILYDWQLSMASFRFCETHLLHIKPFVVNKSAMRPFLGGIIFEWGFQLNQIDRPRRVMLARPVCHVLCNPKCLDCKDLLRHAPLA